MTRAKYMKGDGVPCPKCYGATRVKGTSPAKGHRHAIRRRRACLKCAARFTTIEMPAGDVDDTARKINDRVEFNDRFMALDEPSRLAVRQMVTALEQAAVRRQSEERAATVEGGVFIREGGFVHIGGAASD